MANQEDIERMLKQHPLTCEIDENSIAILCGVSRVKMVESGTSLWLTGDIVKHFYLVIHGQVRFDLEFLEGQKHFMGFAMQGGYFGDLEVLNRAPTMGTATTTQDSKFLLIPQKEFFEIFNTETTISRKLARIYSMQMRGMQKGISILLSQSIETKLALLFLNLYRETSASDGETITLKLGQEDLANMLGVTRQSISKPLQEWKKNGWISFKNRHVQIHCPEELEKLSNIDSNPFA